jgi:multicomponent Na+:H+ antiporter subunit A
MPVLLLLPILILTLGVLAVPLLGVLPRVRGLCIFATVVAGLALGALWHFREPMPVLWVASGWRPLSLFGAPFTFEVDGANWVLAMVLLATSFLSLVGCCASADRPTPTYMALILAVTGAGVAALFASSFVALVVAWGVTDVFLVAAMLCHGQTGARRAGIALLSGILATTALWATPLFAQAEGVSGFLNLAHLSGPSATMLQIAVILRLGLVPLHLWRPIDLETEPAQLVPLVAVPTLLGFDLLTYLPALTAGLPSGLFALAAVTLLAGGFAAWSETEERPSLAGVIVAETGLAVLAVANAGQQAVATAVAAATAWALGITIFSLTPGWTRRAIWRGVPSLIALLSLVGLPSTLGFVLRIAAYGGLEADLLALALAFLGETLVIAALLRLWLWAEPRSLPKRRPFELAYLAVFATAAGILVFAGLFPQGFPGRGQDTALRELNTVIRQGGIAGWTGWALPLVAGVTLFLMGEGLRQRLESGWQGIGALLRLEWFYGLFYVVSRWAVRLMRGISSVVEGEGALLWTAVILLIVLLYLTGNGGGPIG